LPSVQYKPGIAERFLKLANLSKSHTTHDKFVPRFWK
jgi:hypothetical protein